MLGYAHLARSSLPEDAEVAPYLLEIEQSSRRAADLCQQMLAYAGKGKFVIGPVDLGQLVQDVTKLLQLSISKKAELNLSLRPQLPTIEADTNQMRQVVMNLVMNASDALNGEGGLIRITTSLIDVERDELNAMLLGDERSPGEYVCLEVSDTGCGMDEATKARIFEPFFTTKFSGRGLGLAAVLGIIRSHHGALGVESAPGRGTMFRLLFPPLAAPAPQTTVVAPAPELRGQGTILVADDEDMVRQVTASMTASLGFHIIEACDGQEAVDELRRDPSAVRAVLLDLTMPRLDGMQAFEAMRDLAPQLPILVMSGYTEMEVKARCPGEGPAAFLQKPFSRDDLVEKLKEVLT
jgi:CheY-like chemotaxis protein